LVRKVRSGGEGVVNPLRQSRQIDIIVRARNNARMRLILEMQAFEIGMIMGQDSAIVGHGIGENFGVIDPLASPTRFLNRSHVVPKTA
jgi:hypothetical protein